MNSLADKVVLIAGASGGLGNFVTEGFLTAGSKVIGVARSIQQSAFAHPKFVALPADLTRRDSVKEMADAAMARFGRIDVLVHVMGGFAGGELIEDTDDVTWDKMMNLNLRSAFNTLRAVLPHMRKAKQGRVVAIGARSAVEPKGYLSAYCASKAALVSLIRTAATRGQGRWHHGQRHPARHHGHASQSGGHAHGRLLEVGPTIQSR